RVREVIAHAEVEVRHAPVATELLVVDVERDAVGLDVTGEVAVEAVADAQPGAAATRRVVILDLQWRALKVRADGEAAGGGPLCCCRRGRHARRNRDEHDGPEDRIETHVTPRVRGRYRMTAMITSPAIGSIRSSNRSNTSSVTSNTRHSTSACAPVISPPDDVLNTGWPSVPETTANGASFRSMKPDSWSFSLSTSTRNDAAPCRTVRSTVPCSLP